MDTRWICLVAGAVPVALWATAWVCATVGMTRALQPRPHRARALAARLVRELGGRIEEGEGGQWRAMLRRGALEIGARISSTGFGDVIALEVKGPRPWVPEGVVVTAPVRDRDGGTIAPPNLARAREASAAGA